MNDTTIIKNIARYIINMSKHGFNDKWKIKKLRKILSMYEQSDYDVKKQVVGSIEINKEIYSMFGIELKKDDNTWTYGYKEFVDITYNGRTVFRVEVDGR